LTCREHAAKSSPARSQKSTSAELARHFDNCGGAMTLVLGTLIASDVLDDSAVVVQDVLAFLDDFDRSSGNDSAATDRQSEGSVTDSLGVEKNDRQIAGIDPVKLSRRRARAEASNRARVQRYHRKKGELHALRRQVASLVGRVALLQQCARSQMQVQQTSALGVTIRRALGSTTGGVSWKRRADVEREMRIRSDQTNAQLKQLLRASLERVSAMKGEAQQAGDGIRANVRVSLNASFVLLPDSNSCLACQFMLLVGEECNVQPQSSGKLDADTQDIAWSNVLRQLYEEACALADLNSLHTIENLDWAEPTFMGPPIEWTSSYSIPHSDPRSVGKKWWHCIQQHCFSPDSGVGLLTVRIAWSFKALRTVLCWVMS